MSEYIGVNDRQDKLHHEFWNSFVEDSINHSEFWGSFIKRKVWNKSYYDLFWDLKGVHLCLRHNVRGSYVAVEVYIENSKELYNFLVEQRDSIEKEYGHMLNFVEAKGPSNNPGKANKIYDRYDCSNICDKSTWDECIKWLKVTSLNMKCIFEKYIATFYQGSRRDKAQWIIPCNPLQYDVIGAFNEMKKVEWKQSVNINIGDIVFIYVGKPYKQIMFKCVANKVDLHSADRIDDSKFVIDDSNYSNTGRYMELEDDRYSLERLREYGVHSIQGPCRVKKALRDYMKYGQAKNTIHKNLPYEREVISIPASGTVELIYKYRVHAHPDNYNRYPYKKSLFYTFREEGGIMKRLFELDESVSVNPNNDHEIDKLSIDKFFLQRLKGYINERKLTFKFSNPGNYKFYILSEPIELINEKKLPKQNNQAYHTVSDMFNDKEFVDRVNVDTKKDRNTLYEEIEKYASVSYTEVKDDFGDSVADKSIIEGEKTIRTIEVKRRNSLARKLKLEDFKVTHGKVYCEVCGIEEELVLDVHHDRIKISEMEEGHKTNLDDLRVICANCHRIVHGLKVSVDDLIKMK